MPEYVVGRIAAGLNRRSRSVKGSLVVLLGLAYKPGTADTRESPTYRIASLLLQQGARVIVVDPRAASDATPSGTSRTSGSRDELVMADAVALLVHHPDFVLTELEGLPGFVLDCRGVTSHATIERL
jgi:UDP-N-acetyl-D-mannosaminuronate dehydrogenase